MQADYCRVLIPWELFVYDRGWIEEKVITMAKAGYTLYYQDLIHLYFKKVVDGKNVPG
jgi:hypothetical protein